MNCQDKDLAGGYNLLHASFSAQIMATHAMRQEATGEELKFSEKELKRTCQELRF